MKKAIYNKRGTRQIINSGWKEFDKQTSSISTGNVYANTQSSSYIRANDEMECCGKLFKPGELLAADMRPFHRFFIPPEITHVIYDKDRVDRVILYMFYVVKNHKFENNRIDPFCWVVTDQDHNLIVWSVVCDRGLQYEKRVAAAREAMSYICN